MRSIFFTLPLLLLQLLVNAQSFQLTDTALQQTALHHYTITIAANDPNGAYKEFNVTNNAAVSKKSRIHKNVLSLRPGHQVGFIYGTVMYAPTANYSIGENITAGTTFPDGNGRDGLITYFYGNDSVGISVVRYTVYDSLNTSDSINVTITYNATLATSVNSHLEQTKISDAAPNPTSGNIRFTHDPGLPPNTSVKIYNSAGVLVKTNTLSPGGKTELDISFLEEGIYFYMISTEGVILNAKKLVIIK